MELAKNIGEKIALNNFTLVYGGGSQGLMGAVADGALNQNGTVVGVIPKFFLPYEVAHKNLSQMHIVESMHERKKLMYDISDFFLVLPGGLGTLDEMFEILTWAQLKFHEKPVYILNENNFFDHLLKHINEAMAEEFIRKEHLSLIQTVNKAEVFFETLTNY